MPAPARRTALPAEPARMQAELRSRLRAAVLEAFSQEDFHNVDMRGIAARSGISETTPLRGHRGQRLHSLSAGPGNRAA